ncbi:MAG: nicotinate (nicotinamide) nucleotide adenylyltransferase [Oscillospiraceae bacterium]|nr:nicotinate (nicotinamide) nucleotide adenylyltransferase [Oscillospiraceae bacterium]
MKIHKKIGIFGGAFDPPHNGHVNLVNSVMRELALDKVIVIPTGTSPHKAASATAFSDRLKMAGLAFPDYEISDIESRPGKSYMIDTLRELCEIYPDDEFYLLIGSDMMDSFDTWKDHEEILKLCRVVPTSRSIVPVSSTEIRADLEKHKHLLPEAVYDYIKQRGLYEL